MEIIMRNFGIFLLVFINFVGIVIAKNNSSLSISANTGNKNVQIQILVKDSLGRKGGCELIPENSCYDEIFENKGGYGTERLGDEVDLKQANSESIQFFYGPVVIGTHTILFESLSYTTFFYEIRFFDSNFLFNSPVPYQFKAFISSGTTMEYKIYVDPIPGAPAPVISKEVTFDVLRGDVNVAYKLNQLSDKKFKNELIKIIDRAEKLSIKCDKKKKKDEDCGNKKAAVNQLNSFIKRMEQALKKDAKDKKKKKFITDEAFNIIKSDAEILIKDLGGKVKPDKKEKKAKK